MEKGLKPMEKLFIENNVTSSASLRAAENHFLGEPLTFIGCRLQVYPFLMLFLAFR